MANRFLFKILSIPDLWRLTFVACCLADPLVGSIATQYLQNREEHDRVARLWTKRYATWLRTVSCPVVLFFVVVASFSSASSPSSLCRPSGSSSHFIRIAIIAWRHHCYFCLGIIFSSTLFGPSLRFFFLRFCVSNFIIDVPSHLDTLTYTQAHTL